MEPVDTPAPAPAADATPIPAVDAAIAADDYSAFEAAERAERSGTPLEAVAPPTPAERPVSRRQAEAERRTREAVDRATTELREENARLKAAAAPPVARVSAPVVARPAAPAAAAPPIAAVPKFQTFEQFVAAKPDASLEEYLDARDDFNHTQRERATAARTEQQQADESDLQRATRIDAAFKAKATTDPDFAGKLNPKLTSYLSIADSQRAGVPVTAGSLILEEMMGSESFMPFAEHFSAHPEELDRLEAVPDHLQHLPPRQRAMEHGRWIVRQMGKLEDKLATPAAAAPAPAAVVPPKPKTSSSAPPPPVDLGRRTGAPADPIAAAVKADDYAAFEQAEYATRAARK